MAIGFNLPGIPSQIRGTAEEAGAVPDLGQAMMQGFRSNLENVQGYPRQLAQQLLSNQLRNKILGVQEKYAEPMAKTSYDQALANLQHQGMVNKFYPELMRSQLSGAGLSQAHQRMVNDQLKRQIDRQRTYDKLLEEYRNQGLPTQQAQQLAAQATAQAHPEQPMESLSQSLLGAEMPDYLSSMAPQQQAPSYAEALGQAAYTPMQQPDIGLRYTPFELSNKLTQQEIARKLQEASLPGGSLTSLQSPVQRQAYDALFGAPSPEVTASLGAQMPSEGQAQIYQAPPLPQEAPSYLQRPEEPAMEMPVAQPAMEQPQQPQSYAQQLQQAGFNTAGANPVYAAEDKLYLERPDFRQELKQQFPNIGVKQFNDFPRNRVITTETLPSGATRTSIQSLGGTEGAGGALYKSQGLYSKNYEDFKHYMDIGDLEGAAGAKKYIDSILNKDQESQTAFDKSYKEWEDSVQEFGADSQKAKDYRARVNSLIRGSVIRQEPAPPKGATPVYDKENNYIGYNQPLSKEQIEDRVAPVGFNVLYPYVSEGVKPYQGTLAEVNAQIENDLNTQKTNPAAQERLYKFLLAKRLLTGTSARESKMIDSPKVKNIFGDIKSALGAEKLPLEKFLQSAEKFGYYENRISREIKNRAQDDFGIINNMATTKIQEARDAASREREFVPAREYMDLNTRITKGAKSAKTKAKTIEMRPNAKGELEMVNNG